MRLMLPVVAALGVLLSAPGAVAAAEKVVVPSSATLTVTGHGYGHGRGMSQYGAEGAARQGLTAQQITAFYYPGTTPGTQRGRVRVQLSAGSSTVIVLPRAGLALRDASARTKTVLPDNGATRWRLTPTASGGTRVAYALGGWRTYAVLPGAAGFAAGGQPVTLVLGTVQKAYRGTLWTVGGSTVNELGLDAYLRGVVPLEMPSSWSPEALKAQAIAARTYAAYERSHPRSTSYQICDTTSCQVYGGFSAERPSTNAAIKATTGQVLLDGAGQPAFTQFSSSSGGWTAAGSMPYLAAQADPYDGWAGNPVHSWTLAVPDTRLEAAFPAVGNLTGITVGGRDGNGDWGGRVTSITLSGTAGTATVSGDTLRTRLGLRSTWVEFSI